MFVRTAAIASLTAVVIFGDLPGDTHLWRALQDAAHAPAFVALSLLILGQIRDTNRCHRAHAAQYLLAFTLCALLAASIEGLQALLGRDASLKDMGTDLLGAVAGLGGHAFGTQSSRAKLALLGISAASIGTAITPLAWSIAAYLQRAHRFPVLAQFQSKLDLYFLDEPEPTIHIQPMPAAWGIAADHTLLVQLGDGRWPGIALNEPVPDWSKHAILAVDLANPGDTPLHLTLRVHDRAHNQAFEDRFNRRVEVPALTRTTVRIALSDIRSAPAARTMDMRHISGLAIFGNESVAGRSLYLNRIWLE